MRMNCGICGTKNTSDKNVFHAKEMKFGEIFDYFQCERCGCVQIVKVPSDLSKYYFDNYYSFVAGDQGAPKRSLKERLLFHRDKFALFNRDLIGMALHAFYPNRVLRAFRRAKAVPQSRILDVGCGAGMFLNELAGFGFRSLTGIDPYVKGDIHYDNGIHIFKKDIHDMRGSFDIIMFNHSFEHIVDQLQTLQAVFRLLADGGICIIRVPTASSYAWEHYKTHWVQLDPPRHLYLHTRESMGILAEKGGFQLVDTAYDSNEFQFWGSEQYQKGISLDDSRSYHLKRDKPIFTEKDIVLFRKMAKKMNREKRGDQAAFILGKRG